MEEVAESIAEEARAGLVSMNNVAALQLCKKTCTRAGWQRRWRRWRKRLRGTALHKTSGEDWLRWTVLSWVISRIRDSYS